MVGLAVLFSGFGLQAQYDDIEEGYFDFPIQPDRINYLSGSMGELRSTHFHAGLDIKTNGREGLDVYAAADGYVSRIKVSSGGYGHVVYIAHPNGTSTVYAHLQKFKPELAQYVLENQYKQKRFSVNLFPERNQFPVKKGEIVGLSGNTGSSSGPHLHFEIRNIKQEVLDPLKFRFSQIRDKIAPIAQRIALKTMDIDSRINGQFGRFEFELKRRGNEYVITDTIDVKGRIGIEIWAHDKFDGAPNRNGIPIARLKDDGETIFSQNIDTIRFSLQKHILIHTNYKATKETRRRYNKLYIDDGNDLNIYEDKERNGILAIAEGGLHPMEVNLIDSYGNQRNVFFYLRGAEAKAKSIRSMRTDVIDNTLVLFDSVNQTNKITLNGKNGSQVLEPAYSDGKLNAYLWDLKRSLPQTVKFNNREEALNFADLVPAASEHSFLADTYSLRFGKRTLFDTVYVQASHRITEDGEEILEVNRDNIPLKAAISAELQPLKAYEDRDKYHIYQVNNPKYPSFRGGEWENEKISFSFSSFGKFTLLKDDTPPTIKKGRIDSKRVSFTIKDDLSGISEFRATLNGDWLLMKYDGKRNLIWSERLDKSKPLTGDLALSVIDNAGNEQIFTLKL